MAPWAAGRREQETAPHIVAAAEQDHHAVRDRAARRWNAVDSCSSGTGSDVRGIH